ncbi:MAG: lysylphosphatidylglycerol synthase transmembrane domain-containing protein [Proteobacteria bacterium]|nr:lysylphosphatidylglycerol synthase transmembrane domain-containing protein [Pseudomonadota bacterium]
MKLAINLLLSALMLSLCLWLVWPGAGDRHELANAFARLEWSSFAPYLAAYLGLQIVVHICRSVRWNNLLAPLGVRVPTGPLLAISSVGFMAILALPVRLGEFVRPGLIRKHGVSASGALGTVAVERIVDGLLISLLVFAAFFMKRGPDAPGWMMPTAYAALGVFSAALVFLVFALWRAEPTVKFCLRLTLLPRLAPRISRAIEAKLLEMIRGLSVLKDKKNLAIFMVWSFVYWIANGLGVWILARAFGLDLSMWAGLAVMGLVGVGISLPNAPGLVGQFQWFTLLGLSVYLGPDVMTKGTELHVTCLAYAITQHLLQVTWYVGMGALGLATPWVSLADLRVARKAGDPLENLELDPPPGEPRPRVFPKATTDEKLAPDAPRDDDPRDGAPPPTV